MPYVGVRTILGRQGIGLPARVQDRFVNELGVETAFDLAELTQADLTSVGVGSSYAKLRAELSRKFGANLEGAPQERRRLAREKIAAALEGSLGSRQKLAATGLELFLEAGGAGKYQTRLQAGLGVATPSDLRALRAADLHELGMLTLHARRFLAAVALAPRVDDAAIVSAALARAEAKLCDGLLAPMGLRSHCADLPAAIAAMPIEAAVCALRATDLEVAGLRLVQRRRVWAALQTLHGSRLACRAGGVERAAAAGKSRLRPPPQPAASSSETLWDTHLLDGCRHVFLDVGANRGINHQQ